MAPRLIAIGSHVYNDRDNEDRERRDGQDHPCPASVCALVGCNAFADLFPEGHARLVPQARYRDRSLHLYALQSLSGARGTLAQMRIERIRVRAGKFAVDVSIELFTPALTRHGIFLANLPEASVAMPVARGRAAT